MDLDGFKANFISLSDLIRAKEAGGRQQDMIDLENLKRTIKKERDSGK